VVVGEALMQYDARPVVFGAVELARRANSPPRLSLATSALVKAGSRDLPCWRIEFASWPLAVCVTRTWQPARMRASIPAMNALSAGLPGSSPSRKMTTRVPLRTGRELSVAMPGTPTIGKRRPSVAVDRAFSAPSQIQRSTSVSAGPGGAGISKTASAQRSSMKRRRCGLIWLFAPSGVR
jgi:hypothetical protein